MDAKMYHGILVQGVRQAKEIFKGERFYWQEDNDPKHSANINRGYLSRKEKDGTLIHLEWPPQSPDLSPIEQIWDYVKSKMDTTERSSKEVMWQKIQKEWNKIPKKVLRKYILSLKSRCAACLNAKGYHTKY
ncbi:hypothetical protein DAPPUDRAFT_101484 [Daphnia pulex]|uniref:Tc1-like transposase DDE domain-containing protein n=1 Tax=Daphnia pulex TaxID=6669 RepID=E9GDJ1_DAPPU|nr:hypothetical protein DAPPUDRAFT_101484 [Daphnia pulex]|eukprot:EFX82090.1 hypothetical protein DAPPUDRAFT_101484 [Daphnia pulex]